MFGAKKLGERLAEYLNGRAAAYKEAAQQQRAGANDRDVVLTFNVVAIALEEVAKAVVAVAVE